MAQKTAATGAAAPAAAPGDAEKLTREAHFLMNIAQFYEADRGKIAALKRAAGDTLGGARGVTWLYRYLPDTDNSNSGDYRESRSEEIYFLVATLFAGDRKALARFQKAAEARRRNVDETEVAALLRTNAGSLGGSLARQRDKRSKESCDRRFRILIDAAPEELSHRLRQYIRLLITDEIAVDYSRLLAHLLDWSHPKRRVQKQWARDYFRLPADAAPGNLDTAESNATEDA